uniref:NADH-ubiquinone oxidoreductase chain 3 n=1 Tax=Schistosoma incognitum TaxID=198245 RepID=G9B6P7_9TREM|nr:NADH dehydrogenase subunit 3 [Schistosoma incognitum]BAN57361.1 NADH dehydrogenase subunit 3 [Schistosoma incognitum]
MVSCVVVVLMILLSILFCMWGYHSFMTGSESSDGSRCSGLGDWFSSFECGFLGQGFSENFFSFSYINLLVLFVVFDLEVSLLLNVIYDGVWFYTFWCYFFFLLLVSLGYVAEVILGYTGWLD